MEDMNWVRRKFLQASNLLGAGLLLNRTASAQHEGHQMPRPAQKPKPGNTVIVDVAQARDVEFVAQYEGDWMLHCHLPHHMMNQMVSMVGPMAMSHGSGSQTGLGMEEGMGMLRQEHALSEDFGPGMGRGMAMTTAEQAVSNVVGQQAPMPHGVSPPGLAGAVECAPSLIGGGACICFTARQPRA